MASERATLDVAERSDFGSRTTRRLRREGLVPGVVYGSGSEARAFQVPEREIRLALQHGGALIDVKFDGKGSALSTVVKDQQRHPVRGNLLHLDLLEVRLDVEIGAETVLELTGADEAPGVVEGGILEHVTREVAIMAKPGDIPEKIEVDVSHMAVGDTIQLSSVTPPEGVSFQIDDPEELTVATLNPPPVFEEPEIEVEEDPELIGEEGAEGEEGADAEGSQDKGSEGSSGSEGDSDES
ncbi:MAG: 50S ribosomal protein L25 [Solirubrobacterales bacterium]|nr:50S ribosomal protein L25 [Solirubrobacterales bacterium]